MAADPIHQFQIVNLFPVAKIGNTEIAFTNSALFMVDRGRRPDRCSWSAPPPSARWCRRGCSRSAEMSYEFVANTMRSTRRHGRA